MVRVRLVVCCPHGHPPETFCLNVSSIEELQARARHKWETVVAQGEECPSHRALTLWATSPSKHRLFKVESDTAFQKLEHLFTAGLADAQRADRTVRVRLELREEEDDEQMLHDKAPAHHHHRELLPKPHADQDVRAASTGNSPFPMAMSLAGSRCCTPTPHHHKHAAATGSTSSPASLCTPLPMVVQPPSPAPATQQWDDAVLLSSIKRSVALWHFGSRLQHLAA